MGLAAERHAAAGALGGIPPEPPRKRWWLARRVLAAAAGVVAVSAGATTVVALNEVGKVVDALGQSRPVKISSKLLAPSYKGGPETLLLVGNDQRPAPKDNPNGFVIPHSNEMLLVRIDPSKPTVSMLSIPRELQVTIYPKDAEPVTTRINAAYGIGGAELMTETIKRVLGISINHVFVLTFPKFRRAVDELGCVYMGVDRRYYHVNEPGGEQYFEINLQPGYQRLCGKEALEFVANRHEDTSLDRDARDQRFLLEVKAQYGSTLFENSEKLERILGRTVETDLHGKEQVLDLLELLIESEGKPVRQVPFNVNLLPTYDTASEQQIHESVEAFLNGTAAVRRPNLAGGSAHRGTGHAHASAPPPGVQLAPTTPEELQTARTQAPLLPFPLEYPRARFTYAGAEPDTLRLYRIHDQQGHAHPIYVVVVDSGLLGQYYDVQGTNWTDPPLLQGAHQSVQVGGRAYEVFYAGEQVHVIAWREHGAVYWIENTLTDAVSPHTMLAVAQQTQPVFAPSASSVGAPAVNPRAVRLTPVAAASSGADLGAAVAFVALALLAGLAVVVAVRQRQLLALRVQIAQALALEAPTRLLQAEVTPRASPLPAAASPMSTAASPAPPLASPRPTRASPAPPSRAAPVSSATVYRARRRLRPLAVAALGALALAGVLAYRARAGAPAHPSLPVAVFNATATPGAAHRLAAALSAAHVRVGAIGNINASLGGGTFVLYPSGAGAQARHLAGLLRGSAAVEPIQPQVQEAVGAHREIVVVIG